MPRPPIDPNSGLFQESLQPAAQPVDTYAQPAPSQLHDLASSLSNFSGDLNGFLQQQQQKQDAVDAIRGQAAATEANGTGYAELVRQGKLATYNSDAFVQSYEETQGAILGKRLAANAVTAYQTWPQRNSQNPDDMNNFIGDYIKQNLPANVSPYVLKGALPYAEQTSQFLYDTNAKERSDQLYQNNVDAHVAASSMDIDNAMDVALAQGKEPDYATLWQHLMATRQNALAVGVRADDYDTALQQAVAQKALEHGDPGLLGMLKNNVPGQAYSYSSTLAGTKLIDDTVTTMTSRQMQMDRLKLQQQQQQDKADAAANTSFALKTLSANPNAVFDEAWLDKASITDPTIRAKIKEWSKDMAAPAPEDDAEIMGLTEQVLNGGGMGVIEENIGPGGMIHNPATLQKLVQLANTVSSGDMKPVLENQAVKDGLDYLKNSLTPGPNDPKAAFNPLDISPDAIQARADFLQSMYAWKEANPQANYYDISVQAGKVLREMQTRMDPVMDTYRRPATITAEIGQQPAYTPDGLPNAARGQRPVADPTLVPTAAEEDAAVRKLATDTANGPWRGPKLPKIDQLSQEQQDKINSRAAELGVDPSVIINEVWRAANGKLVAPPEDGGSPQGQYVTPSMPNPPGMVEQGNIDLSDRNARVANGDGTYATVAPIGLEDGGGNAVLIPSVIPDGRGGWKRATDTEAEAYYRETGENLGRFNSAAAANAYAQALTRDLAATRVFGSTNYEPPPVADGSDGNISDEALFRGIDKASLPAGMRNDNPGNIKYVPGNNWRGQVGPSQNTDQGDPQVVFDSSEAGMRAAAELALRKFRGGYTTIRELIAGPDGWTPGYTPGAEGVARASGIGLDQPLSLTDPGQLAAILRGIVAQEHGAASALYSDALIRKAVADALNL